MSTNGLVVWLPFDNSATEDKCGNTWTAYGTAPTIVNANSVSGKACDFSQTSGYIYTTPPELGTNNFTIDWWEYIPSSRDSFTSEIIVIDGTSGVAKRCLDICYFNSSQPMLFIGKGAGASSWAYYDILIGSNIRDQWVHRAVVRNGSTIYAFENGQLYKSFTCGTLSSSVSGSSLFVGGFKRADRPFVGKLDNVRVYVGTALWTANFTPPTAEDYTQLALELDGQAPLTLQVDVERQIYNSTRKPVLQYLSFTGNSGCYAELPLAVLAGATTFTIEAKISTVSTKSSSDNWTWGTIAGREIGYNWKDDFGLCVNGGKLCFWAEPKNKTTTTANNTISTAVVNDGLIHKVAVVSSNGAIDLYCDGVLVAHTNNVNAKITNSATILLAYDSDSNSYLQMDLYEARFWSVARTQAEIFADIQGNENGLEAWYLPSSEGLKDYSGNNRHATLYGSPVCTKLYSLPIEQSFDIERQVQNTIPVQFDVDVERVVWNKWWYVNQGDADDLITASTILTDLPETQSKTGTAFYQTTRAKCFDLPATTDEIWLKFDVYFDGENRWRAYNGGSAGTTGITAQTSGQLGFFVNDGNVRHVDDICKTYQLQTVLLHMKSGASAGVVEAWIDGEKIYTYTGDVNHGENFADIYLQSDGEDTVFSNVLISNAQIGLNDGYQKITFDAERRLGNIANFTVDVQRQIIPSIIVPFVIGEHFNHYIASLTLASRIRIVLPKSSDVYVRGKGVGRIRVSSDTDADGEVTGNSYFGDMYAQLEECEIVYLKIEPQPFSPQHTIKKFIQSLIRTNLEYGAAVDEAVNYATDGKFKSRNELVNNLMSDLNNARSYTEFLWEKCGIILGNEDTGAIIGSDASGGGTSKTATSIVPEPIPVENWIVPTKGSTSTINGLNVHWATVGANGRSLSDAENHIQAGLNSVWIEQCLILVKNTLGIDFTEESVTTNDLQIKFENDASNHSLAYIQIVNSGLELVINMHYYKDIDTTSVDGTLVSSSSMYYSAGYLDRTLAHELAHAVIMANCSNISKFGSFPTYIQEGTAEIVHGIDDLRGGDIVELLTTSTSTLQWILSSNGAYMTEIPARYAAGYLFLRYLAKQKEADTFIPDELEITDLLISDSATDSAYNSLTDNTRQILALDISQTLIKTIAPYFDIEIQDVIPVEFDCDVWRKVLAQIVLFPTDSEEFFADEVVPTRSLKKARLVKAQSSMQLPSVNDERNTTGIKSFEISLAEQQITDQVNFTGILPLDIMQQVKGQYLDYFYDMRVEIVQQEGILYSCKCCSDIDALLYTQMSYKVPANTIWHKVGENNTTQEIQTSYPSASTHVQKIAAALGLQPVMQFENFLSTVLMDDKGGLTYNDLIRDIFGWSSRVPTKLINIYIRDKKLSAVQRGHEAHTIDISNEKCTMPIITRELVRTTWGSTPWSKTETREMPYTYWQQNIPDDIIIGQSGGNTQTSGDTQTGGGDTQSGGGGVIPSEEEEPVKEVSSKFKGLDTEGHTTYTYNKEGLLVQTHTYVRKHSTRQNTYTTVNNWYDDDKTLIHTETLIQSMGDEGDSSSRTVEDKVYVTLPNGEKFLSVESTSKYEGDENSVGGALTPTKLVDSMVTTHSPSRAGQSHTVSVNSDGEILGSAVGQNTGDDRVTPFSKKTAVNLARKLFSGNSSNNSGSSSNDGEENNSGNSSIGGANGTWITEKNTYEMTINGLSLYDSSFPIHDKETLIKLTNELKWLNRKTKETVTLSVYELPHLIDFNDRIIFNGNTYYLVSNTATSTSRIFNEQNLTLVRWY